MTSRWETLLSPLRYTREGPRVLPAEVRSPFAIDQDRILFSSSFRRLAKKTQVHPLTRNDHIHSRLSHSLEVASVARTIGLHVGAFLHDEGHLPAGFDTFQIGEILFAACLAHDIGNPPFGHAGESAIQDWFADPGNELYVRELSSRQRTDFLLFDGNAQGLRVVTSLENNKDRGGLRLTFPTLAATVKYPRSSHEAEGLESKKFNFYQSEKELFHEIFASLGLHDGKYLRHPLAYLAEAADDICYRIIDMEDAHELKIISYADIQDVLSPLAADIDPTSARLASLDSDRRRIGVLRTLVIGKMVKSVVQAFADNYDKVNSGEIFPLIGCCDAAAREYMEKARDIFYRKIAREPQKMSLEIGSYSMYKILLDVFIPATYNTIKDLNISYKNQRALDLMGVNAPLKNDDLYLAYHRVIDFITGMTDSYASFLSRQFSGTGSGK